ncbi:hypothetical protein EDD85DRAFT_785474 [Armillaria nabsnona]|nr:hypothetical protein EDD85DRAFT_785474 [Armillaria nabsnona]
MSQASTIQFPSRDPSPAPEYHELYHDYNSDASSVSSSSSSFRRRRRRAGVVGADAVRAVSLSSTASSDSGHSDQSDSEPEVEKPAVPIPKDREEKRAERPRGRRVSRKPKVVKLRIELHLEIEMTMKATIRGDITISLLTFDLGIFGAKKLYETSRRSRLILGMECIHGNWYHESEGIRDPINYSPLQMHSSLHFLRIRKKHGEDGGLTLSNSVPIPTHRGAYQQSSLESQLTEYILEECEGLSFIVQYQEETIKVLKEREKRRPKLLSKEKANCSLRVKEEVERRDEEMLLTIPERRLEHHAGTADAYVPATSKGDWWKPRGSGWRYDTDGAAAQGIAARV